MADHEQRAPKDIRGIAGDIADALTEHRARRDAERDALEWALAARICPCGYDLRGCPPSTVCCPECGRPRSASRPKYAAGEQPPPEDA
jgi:hypothetical protein